MNFFAVILLCIQACLVQIAFSQCSYRGPGLASISPASICNGFGYGGASMGGLDYGLAGAGLVSNIGATALGAAPVGAYGGVGEGNVAVIGELPVSGNTAIIGQVPIVGSVNFGGDVPAAGSVSISGRCACECGI